MAKSPEVGKSRQSIRDELKTAGWVQDERGRWHQSAAGRGMTLAQAWATIKKQVA